jgi:septation ring formation regulator EzrA
MDILIKEMPDVLLMANTVIPKRMKDVNETYKEMTEEGYNLEYLNVEYNLEESKKNIEKILENVKMIILKVQCLILKLCLNIMIHCL